MSINPVLTAVLIFFLGSLISGLPAGWGTKTFRQFAIGDKKFSVATLVATIVATNFGGGFLFRDLEQVYSNGLYYAFASALCYLSCVFFSRFMIFRMGEFMNNLSIAESMGILFGKSVRVITALSGMLFSAGAVALQIQVIARVIKLCCAIESNSPVYVAVTIVLLYSTFGGIKAVTFTDVIQFITFTTLIPVLLYLVSRHISSYTSVVNLLTTHPNFDLRQVVGFHPKFIDALCLMLFFAFPGMDPATMQRVYMAKNLRDVRSSFDYTAVIGTMISVIVIFLAIALLTYDANLNPEELVEHILKIHDYVWLKSFVCIGILALAMSTADSDIHSAAVLLTNDVLTIFKWQPKNKLRVAHLSSLLITLIGLWISFHQGDLLSLLLLVLDFYQPIVPIPFIMAVFGFRPRAASVLLGMGAGGLTVIAFAMGLGRFLNIQDGGS